MGRGMDPVFVQGLVLGLKLHPRMVLMMGVNLYLILGPAELSVNAPVRGGTGNG